MAVFCYSVEVALRPRMNGSEMGREGGGGGGWSSTKRYTIPLVYSGGVSLTTERGEELELDSHQYLIPKLYCCGGLGLSRFVEMVGVMNHIEGLD